MPAVWSQATKLVREGAVSVVEGAAEPTYRVAVPGRISPTVTLLPDDGEWTCDCDSRVDPCVHVAAAAIGAASADLPRAEAPKEAEASLSAGKIRYRLDRSLGALTLERVVVFADGSERLFEGSIASAIARAARDLPFSPTHADLLIDRMVSGRRSGFFPDDRLAEIFGALAEADVTFEGAPCKTSQEKIPPLVKVKDDPERDGILLVVERNPRIEELVVAGVVRVAGVLHPAGDLDLTGHRLEKLPFRRSFARADLGSFVASVLPDLERRLRVEIAAKRLPRMGERGRPRVAFELTHAPTRLTVLPTLVYGDPPTARIDDGKLVLLGNRIPQRDEAAEQALVMRLRDELHLVPGRRVEFNGADATRLATRIMAFAGDGKVLRPVGELVPRLVVEANRFDLSFTIDRPDDDPDAPEISVAGDAVIRAWREGMPLVPLAGGGFATLPTGFLDKYGDRVLDLLEARREDGAVEAAVRPMLAELCDALERPRPPELERLRPLVDDFETLPEAPLPKDLTATLRTYQRQGVNWLCFLRDAGLGAVLADDMGLGKTLQMLCAIRGRTLVICPRSVIHNWEAEIRRFRPKLKVSLYHGARRSLDPKADITLTTYALLRLDAEALSSVRWDVAVLDEAQAIKNPDSQVARAAFDLDAGFRVSLSGTPVENRLGELWSQMHFTNRGLLGGRRSFEARFERPIGLGDPGVAASLRAKIRPFVLRRLKRDVAPELPPRTDSILYVELDEQERAVYDAVRAATQKEIVARLAEGGSVLAALEALLRLRQAACHSSLVPGQHAETSSKVERLVEALEDAVADGHKALVFSQWTSLLDRTEPALEAAGIRFNRLDGSTRDRAGVVAAFQRDDGPPVMLVSLKAGGTGLNLTAADHVFLLDPWWNPAVEDQAKDRAHRIGQERPVFVYRLVAKATVEEGILALQEKKRALADAALGEADQAGGLTRDDLLALFEAG